MCKTNALLVLTLAAVTVLVGKCLCERIVIHTRSDQKKYNFFPLRTNFLEFSVKAESDVHIALTNTYDLKSAYYEIVFGGWRNTKSIIRRDSNEPVVEHTERVVNKDRFQTFWIAMNDSDGSISAGKDFRKPLLVFKDPDYIRMSYFGISTGYGSDGEWNFNYDMLQVPVPHHVIQPRSVRPSFL